MSLFPPLWVLHPGIDSYFCWGNWLGSCNFSLGVLFKYFCRNTEMVAVGDSEEVVAVGDSEEVSGERVEWKRELCEG